uniref:protein-tyrosine-phosphatase n=1 Tax=Petromyzon marinus TaxID=7757 RepID=A0AAJ7XHZ9_PETMA|nr:tyrosine-protein phosphatase non-receptor type 1-like isoform X1 [Petromyzon marinus]XP_032834878.1 tyrosine-protein phosphatase non-receptor type 1-like isoform X2 [Petromyzon marinus]
MEEEFEEIDRAGNWTKIFNEIKEQSRAFPYKVAKRQENRLRNRYRDVSPYDHSRVRLEHGVNDYINASLMHVEAAQRRYILTQGPLPSTCGHFWQMAWEQRSRAVVMLNRLVEKGSVKCAQYWPSSGEREVSFPDVALRLTLLGEQVKVDYTLRQLQLHNLTTGESRTALHFHYTTWPDFGVPDSPASFLSFLQEVRSSGALGPCHGPQGPTRGLGPCHGPSLVHCSAGIGRSGTFCLVDTCLLLMAGAGADGVAGGGRGGPRPVDVRAVLLEMRRCRMGLIQTPDQLRFSYLAIIEGAKTVMAAPGGGGGGGAEIEERWMDLSNDVGDDGDGGGGATTVMVVVADG